MAGRYKSRDGYTKNLLGGDNFNSLDTAAVRTSFAWVPSDDIRADVIVNYERDTPNGTGFKSGTFNPTDPATGAPLGNLDHNSGAALSAASGFPTGNKLGIKREVWGVTGLFTDRISSAFTLTSISAWRKFNSTEIFDPDGFSLPLLSFAERARGEQESQELRINYDEGGPITWFAGASYFHDNGFQAVPSQIDERMTLALLTGQLTRPNPQPAGFFSSPAFTYGYGPAMLQGLAAAYGVALPAATAQGIAANLVPNHQESFTNFGSTTAYDFYGEATWRITPQIELTGGLRYSDERKISAVSASTLNGRSIIGGFIGALSLPAAQRDALLGGLALPGAQYYPDTVLPNFGLIAQPTAGNGTRVSQELSDGGFTWRATARYKPEKDTSFYISYARGRRPEVLAAQAPSAPYGSAVFTPVASEKVNSYEIGAKTLTLDGNLRLDGAIYYYTYDNFQTVIQNGAVLITTNAGKAKTYGFEGQADWSVAPWADIFATYSYSHGRFDTGLYKGNQFRLAPDHKLSLGASLSHEMLGGVFTLTPTYTWQSKIFFDDNNDIPALQKSHILPDLKQDEFQDAYGLVNLRLAYQPADANWTAEAFVSNVTGQKYIKDAGNTGDSFGIPTFIAGEPRFYGVSFTLRGQ